MEDQFIILIRLVLAHILADFFLQPDSWVHRKWKGQIRDSRFWMHIGVVGLTTYLLLMQWGNWQVPLIIMLSHAIIDSIKLAIGSDNTRAFVLDQLAHLLSILLVWFGFIQGWEALSILWQMIIESESVWLVVTGYLINTIPLSVLIRYLTARWSREVGEKGIASENSGLREAGKYIGIAERLLVFTFIIFNEMRAIGFLLAAKSVFRFGDLKDSSDRKKTEYILLGTLISFTTSILLGLLIRAMM